MRATIVFVVAICLFAIPLAADCPTVLNPDDPPCVPCSYIAYGPQLPRWIVWADYSEIVWYVQNSEDCDGNSRQTVVAGSIGIYCPNSDPTYPCSARDSGWLP